MAITNIAGTDLVENGPVTINNNFAQAVLGSTNLTVAGAVPYVSSSGTLNQDATQFFWNASTNRLGLGTNSPGYPLHLVTTTGVNATIALDANSGADQASLLLNISGNGKYQVGCQPNGDFFIYDSVQAQDAFHIGNTTGHLSLTPAGDVILNPDGKIKFIQDSTGGGSAALSTNCPAITPTAPYTWITVKTSDGSTGYIPVWK